MNDALAGCVVLGTGAATPVADACRERAAARLRTPACRRRGRYRSLPARADRGKRSRQLTATPIPPAGSQSLSTYRHATGGTLHTWGHTADVALLLCSQQSLTARNIGANCSGWIANLALLVGAEFDAELRRLTRSTRRSTGSGRRACRNRAAGRTAPRTSRPVRARPGRASWMQNRGRRLARVCAMGRG